VTILTIVRIWSDEGGRDRDRQCQERAATCTHLTNVKPGCVEYRAEIDLVIDIPDWEVCAIFIHVPNIVSSIESCT